MERQTFGLLGLGAFGKLMVRHLIPHFTVKAYDPSPEAAAFARANEVAFVGMEEAAACDIVAVAVPVPRMEAVFKAIAPCLKKGALVLDVGSVKIKPARWMAELLPDSVDCVATHPLFGPQSAPVSIKGQKIALCPVRGERLDCVAAFCRDKLELDVLITTPEAHDREVAYIQGITHMVGKVLTMMEPLPETMTTKSFDLLIESKRIVHRDSEELFLAIQRENPFSAEVRELFFAKAGELQAYLKGRTE